MRRLFYCDHYQIVLPDGHKFPMRKYRMLREQLAADGSYNFEPAPLASREEIELAHDPDYVRQFFEGTLPPNVMRRIGFPWSPDMVLRSQASVGGTVNAAYDALATGFGGNLAGGTHHAFRAEGSGFCVFNDIAVAIQLLRAQKRIRRAAIIDLDVHQGDGTAQIFADDPEVLTLSFHGRNNFPFRKQKSKIDVEFEDNTTDEDYLAKLEEYLPAVWAFQPDIVFYQSGVDALKEDRLGRLALTHDGLRARDEIVMRSVIANAKPFVITLGGGYAEPIELTVDAHAQTFQTALEIWDQ